MLPKNKFNYTRILLNVDVSLYEIISYKTYLYVKTSIYGDIKAKQTVCNITGNLKKTLFDDNVS